jgi:ribosome-associated protein
MAKAQSKTTKKTNSKPAKPTKKKVAKAAVKKPAAKPIAKVAAKTAGKSVGKASKTAAKKTAKVATKASKTAAKKPVKKAAGKVAAKAPAKASKALAKAAKVAPKAAKSAPKKAAASTRKPKGAAVATAAETTQVMEDLLAHATAGDGQPTAPQHRDAAASLVTDEHELDAEIEGAGHQDDDENFDGHDDMDDASFNDRSGGKGGSESEPAGRPTYTDDGSPFPVQLARMLHDDKCTDIVLLDLRGVNPMWDYVIIGSGTSDRQMRSVLTHVAELGRLLGHEVYRRNVDDRATWLLADFSDVIVHLFEPNTRAHYDLEMLWGDATRVEWERPAQLPRNRAGLVAGDGL